MSDKLPAKQQRVINHLLSKGWEENGATNRLRKGNRRVYIAAKETNFSIATADGPGFVQVVPNQDFKKIQELA